MPEPMETGIVVPVPELDDFTGQWRKRVDAVPPERVPAHITLLYPFIPPTALDGSTRQELVDFFATSRPFDFDLTEVARFGDDVVYLAPEPSEPFVRLTEQLSERWPEYPPYEDQFDEIVPHLTIGSGCTPEGVELVTRAVENLLPIRSRASQAWLMVGRKEPSVWQVGDRFDLGSNEPAAVGG